MANFLGLPALPNKEQMEQIFTGITNHIDHVRNKLGVLEANDQVIYDGLKLVLAELRDMKSAFAALQDIVSYLGKEQVNHDGNSNGNGHGNGNSTVGRSNGIVTYRGTEFEVGDLNGVPL